MNDPARFGWCLLLGFGCGPSTNDDAADTSTTSATTGAASSSATSTSSTGAGSEDTGCNEVPADAATLAECNLAEPCGSVFTYDEFNGSCVGPLQIDDNPYDMDESCVLEALASGQPAVVHLEGSCTDIVVDRYVYLLGDGVVMTAYVSGGPCFGCGCDDWSEDWGPVRSCTLADPTYFENCLDETDPAARVACMTPETWYSECTEAPATCRP